VLYPGAFADLSSHLLSLMHYDRIKVFAAGAFHNLLLSALALICIVLLPFLLSPLYQVPSDSVVVSSVHPLSPLAAHITAGEQILSLNRCRLEGQGQASWSECLDRIHAASVEGFCMPHDFIVGEQDANGNACCHSDAPSKLQCFALSAFAEPSLCTSARLAADRFRQCSHGLSDCADGELCATPALLPSEKLVKISKANDDFVLYAGHLSTLWHGIEVSRYLPRFALFSSFLLACPHPLYLMLYYIATLSTGLGVLNLVPAYWLDGEHIMGSILHILWPDDLKKRKRWGRIVLRSSTFLLVANIVVSLIILYYRNRFENQV
jgi:S2P endopeptidase